MGVSISVGALAGALKSNDADEVKSLRRDLKRINRLLAANGLPEHAEPEALPSPIGRPDLVWDRGLRRGLWLSGMPYSWIHYLRRAVAHARHAPKKFGPAPDNYDSENDELILNELSIYLTSHVICHSDSEGYYVPVEFAGEPLVDNKLVGAFLGSSQTALQELVRTAPLLGIRLRRGQLSDRVAQELCGEAEGSHPYWIERHAWLYLFENLRLSVEFKTAVIFG
jgi:hypothetical protein